MPKENWLCFQEVMNRGNLKGSTWSSGLPGSKVDPFSKFEKSVPFKALFPHSCFFFYLLHSPSIPPLLSIFFCLDNCLTHLSNELSWRQGFSRRLEARRCTCYSLCSAHSPCSSHLCWSLPGKRRRRRRERACRRAVSLM